MGGEQGIIYLADDFGLCSERYKIGSPLSLWIGVGDGGGVGVVRVSGFPNGGRAQRSRQLQVI